MLYLLGSRHKNEDASMKEWRSSFQQARLEELLPDGRVRCHLSPRNCTMREGEDGFCKVRGVRNGRLVTMNYAKSVHPTQETVETEAVNHFAPGAGILSCGNIGCMMACSYCHNWRTSQAKHVQDKDVFHLTSEYAVDVATRRSLPIISYTYNDPVVWHEWVLDTARLAREHGLLNLYKSAFYISGEAIEELLPDIDIFSISLKSMDPQYYKKYTGGRLEPVLEGIKQVYESGRHLELSTLMITDISDNEATARQVAEWVLTNLDSSVPMHFVRFHPDFRMRNTIRTPVDRLERAREIALEMGIQHVYLGNVYDTKHSNTYCNGCGAELVLRYGLNARVQGLDSSGCCVKCGKNGHFKFPMLGQRTHDAVDDADVAGAQHRFCWHGDIRSVHAQMLNPTAEPQSAWHRHEFSDGHAGPWERIVLEPGESWRFIVAKSATDDIGAEIRVSEAIQSNLHEVFDRAHFPTITVEQAPPSTDVAPFPIYPGRQMLRTTE
jgi:pyruvate formate lyase activating enzyme